MSKFSVSHSGMAQAKHQERPTVPAAVDSEQLSSEPPPNEAGFKEYPDATTVVLPRPMHLDVELQKVLTKRHSTRDFAAGNIPITHLSTLLFLSAGITTEKPGTHSSSAWSETRRSYPSAGARYPIELYAIVLQQHEPMHGVYHYNVKSHSLELLRGGDFSRELKQITGEDWIADAQCVIALTAVFHRTTGRYDGRGNRYIWIEAGHVMQNICLVSQALNLGSCPIGSFTDSQIDALLGINGQDEGVLYLAAVGKK